MQITIPTDITPASLAATLLSKAAAQYATDLKVSSGSQLSLSTAAGKSVTTLPEIAQALFESAGKTSDLLGKDEAATKEVQTWLTRIGKGEFTSADGLKALEKEVSSRTFLVGNTPTAADLSLAASLQPSLTKATESEILSYPSVARHYDHIQSTLPSIASVKEPLLSPLSTSLSSIQVPLIEIKPEVKVKKPKAGEEAAAPAAGAAAAVAGGEKKEKAPKEKKVQQETAPAPAEEGAAKKPKEKKEKKEKAPGGGDGGKKAAAAPVNEPPAPWQIDLRVGKIIDVKLHPDADSLYVEQIDVGEDEPRTVVSGLVKYIPIEEMRGKTLITVCNLKPANMRGVKSFAMVLCASSKEGKDGGIEFVEPPAGSLPGDRVYFEGFEDKQPLDLLNPKKKIFETIQPGFTTLENRDAAWIGEDKKAYKIVTKNGVCAPKTLVGASLS